MACQLYRKDGKVDRVLAPNGEDSILYKELLNKVKEKGVKKYLDQIPYLKNRLDDGTLLNESPEEIAVGLWSIAYSSEYQEYFTKKNSMFGSFADANGEPKSNIFNNDLLDDPTKKFVSTSVAFVLDPERKEFLNKAGKKGNALQKRIVNDLIENSDNPVVLEPSEHVYVDEDGETYTSVTTGIKGKLMNDEFAINREYGTSFDKLLQGVILGQKFEDAVKDIDNIPHDKLKTAYGLFQVYINMLTKDGSIIVTQAAIGDKYSKIAGSLDLLVITPDGKIKIVDLKASKNSVKSENYDKKYLIKDDAEGSVFKGQSLSTRQQHGIQLAAYKKLIELKGFDVVELHTLHLKLDLDVDKKIKDIEWEGEEQHSISMNQTYVNKLIPTDLEPRNRLDELKKELGIDNPVNDPDFLSEEDSKPEIEIYGDDKFTQMYDESKKVINTFEARKKYLEKIRKGKTFIEKDVMIDKINELMAMMGSDLRNDRPSLAYGAFLNYAMQEITDYHKEISDPKNMEKPNYASLLIEVDKYIESYRGIINAKGVGSKEQQLMLVKLIDTLDDVKESIDNNLESYVKNVIKSNTSRDLTQDELNKIMKEVYDIPAEDYYLGDLATSKDTLLAIADKIYKAAVNKAKDNSESTASKIAQLGNNLLKAFGIKKTTKDFYDFMKVFKNGKFTGRYVSRVGSQYYDKYYEIKNTLREKNGDKKQYIPITDITKASDEDLQFNILLFRDKTAYREFMNAETIGPQGAKDGKYHKYTDFFKTIRDRYQDLVAYSKPDGELFYKWEKKEDVTDEQYEQFRLKYFNEATYWSPQFESDGTFQGRVTLKTNWFVKSEFVEIRDIAEDGTDLRDPKYVKLMNPVTEQEKAQSNFYKGWVEEYQNQLEKLPQDVASAQRGKVGRVRGKFMETLKKNGGSFTKAVAKSLKDFFSTEIYTNQRIVDELGQVENGLPILYVGKLQNEKRVEYLKKELEAFKQKKLEGKISQKEFLEKRNKLKEYIKIEESKIKVEEIEGDLVENLIQFAAMAENFEIMSNIESDLQAIAKIMEDRDYYEIDSLGNKLIRKGSKLNKESEGKAVVKRKENVFAIKRLNKWFKMVYYNNEEFNRTTMALISKRIQNLTSLKGVGFNIFGNINNYVMGRINNSIETAGSLYYDRPAANRAVGEYNKDYLPNIFRGLGEHSDGYQIGKKAKSKYEAIVEYFRMVRHYQKDQGKVDFMSWAYLLQEGGEFNVQSKTGVAITMTRTLKNSKTGETLSVYDAFDFNPNTGELKLKDGFEMSDKERYDLINYILEVNKQIHGNYAFQDRMVIQDHWIGQLAAQFHKWIYPAYKSRFKERYIDENLGTVEGRYVTVLSFLKYVKEAEGTFIEKLRTGWKDMDSVQIKNMYKNLAELAFLAASFALYGIVRGIADGIPPEDKFIKRWLNFLAYQQSRQVKEISTMMPLVGIEEQYQIAKSPFAILTTLKDFGQAVEKSLSLPIPPYEKNYYERGTHKGDLKVWKEWKDVIPALNVLNKWDSYDQVKSFYIK
jgi:hypothetical protein